MRICNRWLIALFGMLSPMSFAAPQQSLNSLSILHTASDDNNLLLCNFQVEGAGPRTILIRAVGPSLAGPPINYTRGGFLLSTTLTVYNGAGEVIATNSKWGGTTTLKNAFAAAGAFPFLNDNSMDAALLLVANPGFYLVRMTGTVNTNGAVGLAEVFDIGTESTSRLAYLAARAVGPTLITSFEMKSGPPQTILVRAVAAALRDTFGISQAGADPTLTVLRGTTVLATNDNWGGASLIGDAANSAGLFPLTPDSKDSAVLLTLAPGTYTAQRRTVGIGGGVGLIEIAQIDGDRAASFAPALAGPILHRVATTGRGSSVTFTTGGVLAKPYPVSYQWRKNGTNIPGATSSSLTINNVVLADDGSYSVVMTNAAGTTVSAPGTLTVWMPPSITIAPPTALTVTAGGIATFTAVATGAPVLEYAWMLNRVEIPGATGATLRIPNVQSADAGSYSVRMRSSQGTFVSGSATLTVLSPPVIATQPAAQIVAHGATAAFAANVTGTPPFSYQWLLNGVPLVGATLSTLTIANAQAANAGAYAVRITNAHGTVTSTGGTLAILAAPEITTHPANLSVTTGATAVFTLVANGTNPLTYQWRKDGVDIPAATAASYSVLAAQPNDAGEYTCVVRNGIGFVVSNGSRLIVGRNYAGTYFGEFTGGRGNWALLVRPDGTGFFLGYLNNPKGGIAAGVNVSGDGGFRVSSIFLQPQSVSQNIELLPRAAAALPFTLAGSIGTSGVTGLLEGIDVSFSGLADSPAGSTTTASGMYQATASGSAHTLYTIAGASRRIVGLVVSPLAVEGGVGAVGENGSFSLTTGSPAQITGNIVPASGTISARMAPVAGPAISFNGATAQQSGPPSILVGPAAKTVVGGSALTLSITAGGKAPLTYQWSRDGSAIAGATSSIYSVDAVRASDTGRYACLVANSEGSVSSAAVEISVTSTARLINLSILADLDVPGDNFTLGYVLAATGPASAKPLVIRAAGPSLGAFVDGTVDDPKLELFAEETKSGENDNWGGSPSLASALINVGAFAYVNAGSKDAAVLANVGAGKNSVRISNVGNGTGKIIAEIYDATPADVKSPRLVNLSVLKPIREGFTIGFAVGGTGTKTLLIRAIGPTLRTLFNIEDAVPDPQLTVLNGTHAKIAENDNWGGDSSLSATFDSVAAFALAPGSRDAAAVVSVEPGNYFVQIAGVSGSVGIVLLEMYEHR